MKVLKQNSPFLLQVKMEDMKAVAAMVGQTTLSGGDSVPLIGSITKVSPKTASHISESWISE